MATNLVSGSLPADTKQQIFDLIDQAKGLMPYLVALSADQRRDLLRLGDRTEAFVRRAHFMANRHTGILARDFDLEELNSDVELFSALREVQQGLVHLTELVNDTVAAVGSDAYSAALDVYGFAKLADADGVNELRALMSRRFSGQGSSASAEAPSDEPDEIPETA